MPRIQQPSTDLPERMNDEKPKNNESKTCLRALIS